MSTSTHSMLWPVARDDIDARAFLIPKSLTEWWPTAGLYVSLPLLDHRVEAFVEGMRRFGVPRTET
ncbi:hypothetical protein ACIBQX_28070 [Nonomuraea sp. NPDC049714]|uniref:hypothetical protein n=1 Tax=Nonomuraea sp. NPDC049714 TaxID=3364357 RepID=UPI0037AC3666